MSATDTRQPYAELGLTAQEYDRIVALLGRTPSTTELAMYAVMWSEHCSYKSSKVHLRRFGALPPSPVLLAGIGENAGVVDVGRGIAVTFKVESHNHPSYVEPYQGAATGVGGIVRDIIAMGARPIAVMDSLRFGDLDAPDTARVLPGVVAGVAGYGNCLGLPNIGGEVGFDPSYAGNPLVNALALGVLPAGRLQQGGASGPGNRVVLFGALTGRDGIGGASVLASATFESGGGPSKRPSVQVGDPFTEKTLIECCLELFDAGLLVGISDLGAAGLSCALSETAAKGGVGMRVALDRVPLRETAMEPFEILTSESQERMLAVVTPEQLPAVFEVTRRWGVVATDIGEITDGGRLVIEAGGEVVADVDPASLADEGPVYQRPYAPPADRADRLADDPAGLPRPADLGAALLDLVASPGVASRRWITDQYDRYVLGNTVLATPHDAGVLRLDEESGLGVALALDGNGRFAKLDPYTGTQLALAEAYRNVACTGARPLAVTNCLNVGSPEEPGSMWEFAEAVRGLADGCAALGLPVTGGNVSFYNSTGGVAINPTPVVGVLGVIDDVRGRVPAGFVAAGDDVLLLGDTRAELAGSEWAWSVHRHLGGTPPAVDLAAEQALAALQAELAGRGLLRSAHDLSEGGLGVALTESCLPDGLGVRIALRGDGDPFLALFAESAGRVLVSCPPAGAGAIAAAAGAAGVPVQRLGTVGGDRLVVAGVLDLALGDLAAAHAGTLPAVLG